MAIPVSGRKGTVVHSGIAALPSNTRTASIAAQCYVRHHYEQLRTTAFGGRKPYIDLEKLIRNGDAGKPVDVWLHVPQVSNATFLAASMVVALITMMWRKPSLIRWSVVGAFTNEGFLYGYPSLNYTYLQYGAKHGITTIILPYDNRPHILNDLRDRQKHPKAHYEFAVKQGKEQEMIFRTWVKEPRGDDDDDGDGREEKKSEVEVPVINREVRVVFCKTMLEVVQEVKVAWKTG